MVLFDMAGPEDIFRRRLHGILNEESKIVWMMRLGARRMESVALLRLRPLNRGQGPRY